MSDPFIDGNPPAPRLGAHIDIKFKKAQIAHAHRMRQAALAEVYAWEDLLIELGEAVRRTRPKKKDR